MLHISLSPVEKTELTPVGINHFYAVDISGSMGSTLPKMRTHLKNRMAMMVKPQDTVTLIYFSGRGQSGVVFEAQPINTLTDLTAVNNAIDKFLQPLGMTAFVDPIELAKSVAGQIKNGNVNSFKFLTDGYDNSYSTIQILESVKDLPEVFDDFTILEYGWYCNRELLSKMAIATGANHVFSEDYSSLETSIETSFGKKPTSLRRVDISSGNVVVFPNENGFTVCNVKDGYVLVPEDVSDVFVIGSEVAGQSQSALLAGLYYALITMNSASAWEIISELKDQTLFDRYSSCFTKQDYTNLTNTVVAYYNADLLLESGSLVTAGSQFTLLDVFDILLKGENFLDTTHEDFEYNRIGRKAVQKDDETVTKLAEQLESASTKEDIKALAQQIVAHEDFNPEFVPKDVGLKSLNNIVFNESRPNISLQTDQKGTVAIPEFYQKKYGLPSTVETKIVRNYAVVKDGIVNMKKLPVVIDANSFHELIGLGVIEGRLPSSITNNPIVLDLTRIPLLSRADVFNRDLEDFCFAHLELEDLKARQKVLKHFRDQLSDTRTSAGFSSRFGEEAAKWMYEIGIRDYGFSPPVSVNNETTDVYLSNELSVKIKGLSSLPSLKAVADKVTGNKKLNISDTLINKWVIHYTDVLSKVAAKKIFIEGETKEVIRQVREKQMMLNRVMYSILIGKSWFDNQDDMDSTSTTVKYEGVDVAVSVVVEHKEVKI